MRRRHEDVFKLFRRAVRRSDLRAPGQPRSRGTRGAGLESGLRTLSRAAGLLQSLDDQ